MKMWSKFFIQPEILSSINISKRISIYNYLYSVSLTNGRKSIKQQEEKHLSFIFRNKLIHLWKDNFNRTTA